MIHRIGRTTLSGCALLFAAGVGAQELVEEPFANTALTEQQREAWDFYIAQESAQYGCRYEDDPRLKDDPRAVLEALASGEDIEPVKVTMRTFLSAGENVQELLSGNMTVASMECNPVYYYDGELIGHPVLPFEEYIDIILRRSDTGESLQDQMDFLRGTKPAAIDARWFWAFFVLNRDHHRLLAHDYESVAAFVDSMPGTPDVDGPELKYWAIYDAAFNQGLYVGTSSNCDGTKAEPNEAVIVDKNIDWENIAELYAREGIPFSGDWSPSVKREEEGYTLAESTFIEDPVNPFFTVTRGVTIQPRECN